ncbi:aminodeoxychorismate synthase component I [Algoriella sp.]|uniref:aminodeoxychorismate synthase component I n=1 Tax=Algoriella sp. TaxID=1872434 RepID=UPI001B1D955A|nr:aminodeoxychorismate synthase component I [Algoriella sp.]MBO6213203.1 aminodeoxychorismate synthase component I [Algoriella sp.]
MLAKHSIFDKMNELGAAKVPFFFMIDFLKENGEIIPLHELNNEINFEINSEKKQSIHQEFTFKKQPISFQEYLPKFQKVHQNLMFGNSYLTNLTYPTKIETDLSLSQIFQFSEAKYKLKYKEDFVCFSPERFVKIENQQIFSNPMKGTIDASIPNAKQLILDDEKEASEHATIVDLIRNDLSLVAENVEVTKYRYIDELKTNDTTLLQVSSEIRGDLKTDFHQNIGTIFDQLLPAGSICGAPKKKTLQIIAEAEGYERKFYTGVFGVFDGENLDSAVMIRFIEKDNEALYFKSGGGITAKSKAKAEYEELIQKVYVPIY